MLQIKSISKKYQTGDLVQDALKNVSLSLRDNEFVSILGPSGSGKTTLLNIIGGLDRYDSGDLIINEISTKDYKDKDWDSYRNHTIGFVFQSYNLIPHQSILANVELALTIGGLSRNERRKRAKEALNEVGLGDQLHKKPNQMSGGQMQRVAIARALVNNPDILLADEPTGALDTETSIQVMELLKKVATNRLVVMVTHNPELAEEYSTRIVKLRDGNIVDDSNPFEPDKEKIKNAEHKNMGKAKMSLLTSLSLSFNNLRTKKGRTILTSFAGSIGIIGIALILALSTGVNAYISDIQKDTMTSYPISISAETIDITGMIGGGMMGGGMLGGNTSNDHTDRNGIFADYDDVESAATITTENNLTEFKKYLDDPESEIRQYLGENGVVYTYNVNFGVYSYDSEDNLVNTDADTEDIVGSSASSGFGAMGGGMRGGGMQGGGMAAMMSSSSGSSSAENFSELMSGTDDAVVSRVITDSYEVLHGAWPENYNEVVLVLDENNALSTGTLYQLGLITADEYKEITEKIENGEEVTELNWNYEEFCDRIFYMIPACDQYVQNEDGTFTHIAETSLSSGQLLENSLELKVTAVVRPIENAANATISTPVAYTSMLTDYVIEHTNESEIIKVQEENPEINVLNGMDFSAADDAQKIADAADYASALGISDKASLYTMIMYYSAEETEESDIEKQTTQPQGAGQIGGSMTTDETAMAALLDKWLDETPDDEILISIYDEYINGSSYDDNLKNFGKISYDAPNSISIYTDSFEDKEAIAACITTYNETASGDNQITYTDYVELMTSSLTSIIDVISYVLIAFVAVSLVVSCIMIGIITHISVLERTKEIGILRALGASKRNISQVFNAETFIIGCCSGLLGVGLSALLTVPINALIQNVFGAGTLSVSLPINVAVILVVLSMVITVIGGIIPSKNAAKKDPVIALRSE